MATFRGWQGRIEYGMTNSVETSFPDRFVPSYAVAQVEGWSIDVDNSTETHFYLGSRSAGDVSVGPKNVTGTFNRLWYTNTFPKSFINPTEVKPSSWAFKGWIDYGGKTSVVAWGLQMSTWGGAGEADGAATENIDFVAANIAT